MKHYRPLTPKEVREFTYGLLVAMSPLIAFALMGVWGIVCLIFTIIEP